MAATYHSLISTVKLQGRSAWDYLGKFFVNIFNGCRDFSVCDKINFRANESRAKLVRAMPSAAENHEINRIGNMPIVNKQMKILTSQYIGTCKSAYTKGYALN